jgi:hypothetical protein
MDGHRALAPTEPRLQVHSPSRYIRGLTPFVTSVFEGGFEFVDHVGGQGAVHELGTGEPAHLVL